MSSIAGATPSSMPKLQLRSRPQQHQQSVYVPGMYDKLLTPKEQRLRPDEIRSVTIDVARSGSAMIVAERDITGAGRRHILSAAEYPFYVDIDLGDGSSVAIEVSRYRNDTTHPLEVVGEGSEEAEVVQLSAVEPPPPITEGRKYRPANLLGSSTDTSGDAGGDE